MSKHPIYIPQAGAGHNQGLRTALALSIMTGQPVRLNDLVDDALRPQAGLGPGGTTTVSAAAKISNGDFEFSDQGAGLEFNPKNIQGGEYSFDVAHHRPSAAPMGYVLEALLLPLSAASQASHLFISGGTHVGGGFTSDEISRVLLPNWRNLGFQVSFSEITPGFHPGGGGETEVKIEPVTHINPLVAVEPFKPMRVGVEVLCSGLPVHLAEQALEGALSRLTLHRIKAQGRIRRAKASAGSALLVWCQGADCWVGFSALGRRGGRPEALANAATEAFVSFLHTRAALPASLAAQLLAPLVFANGVTHLSVDRLSAGLKGAVSAVEAFFPGQIRLSRQAADNLWEISIRGVGLYPA